MMKLKAHAPNPTGKAKAYSQAIFIIWSSAAADGRTGWEKVKPEDVPDWVLSPKNLGRLVNGYMCMDPTVGEKGSLWYRADVFLQTVDRKRLERALAANKSAEASAMARKLMTLH